ncbi:tyrosine-type recombinase/integrase [Calidifontibacillus oryziterrae]|uniref:tyrosine-type recombinase/integrase n=1 Tax=Calidifontibacillus oryziterrae TaxID=1191699 RepID=UPI0002DAA183|nr:tyrosine-type recombinase/integrase [Calidifontibacillus oryziterrae]
MTTDVSTIDQFEEWLLKQDKSPNTVKTYISVIQKFRLWLEERGQSLEQLNKSIVQDYMNELEMEGKSAATIDKIFATIRVYTQFINRSEITENIHRKEKEKNIYQTVPEFLNKSERATLLQEVEKDKDVRNIAIVYMLLYTGIRLSELCNLDRSHVEIAGDKGNVNIVILNGSAKRTVPIPEDALKPIKNYIDSLSEDYQGPLFISKQNKRLTTRSIQYMLEKYNINPHKLRHTFCHDLIEKGVDIATVAQLAGHNDINITKRYKIKGA